MKSNDKKHFLSAVLSLDLADYADKKGLTRRAGDRGIIYFDSPLVTDGSARAGGFLVVTSSNTWQCRHTQQSGNILDLDMLLHHCSIQSSLDRFYASGVRGSSPLTKEETPVPERAKMHLIREGSVISDRSIGTYFREQQIPLTLAKRFFREYTFLQNGIMYTGFGAPDTTGQPCVHVPYLGPYFLRNDFTMFDRGTSEVLVFSSAIDMLHSAKHMDKNNLPSMVLLNSIHAFESAREVMEVHGRISLLLPRNAQADQYVGYAQWLSDRYMDNRNSYGKHESITASKAHGLKDKHEHQKKSGRTLK